MPRQTKADLEEMIRDLVEAAIQHCGGGVTKEDLDLGEGISIDYVIMLMEENADELEHTDARMRAYLKQLEDAGIKPVSV